MYPKDCFNNKSLSYSGSMYIDVEIAFYRIGHDGSSTPATQSSVKRFKVCNFPIMVKSDLCNLHGLTKAQQFENDFDPNDNGGYFIIHGSEWQITLQESVKYNELRIMKCGTPKDKVVRKTSIKTMFISKFGDGYGLTYSLDINMNDNGEIYLGIIDPFN